MKQSSNKLSYPGRKQIFRQIISGHIHSDRLGLSDEKPQGNEQGMLQIVMRQGNRLHSPESLDQIRQRTASSIASLSDPIRKISNPQNFAVNISDALESLRINVAK